MGKYIFIHGKNASLSRYELECVFEKDVDFQTDLFSVIETSRDIDRSVMDSLGGTIKICEVFSGDPVDLIERKAKSDKILFAVSQYGGHEKNSAILLDIKKELKARGHNSRFLNKDFENVSSGQLNKSMILEKGLDMVRCFFKGQMLWGRTIFFQNIDAYSIRDYEKPKRDMKVGMLPPKLAQMMINFAKPKKDTTIYDPFCGLGTIMLEAVLRGNPIMGSDINGRMAEATQTNLEWLSSQLVTWSSGQPVDQNTGGPADRIFLHDATHPFPKDKFPKDLVVVTESYLGPPLLRFPNLDQERDIFQSLHKIYSLFFAEIGHIIKSGKRLVFCFPYFRDGKSQVFYPENHIREYEANGFKILNKLGSLLYERQNQVVGREIVVFEKA